MQTLDRFCPLILAFVGLSIAGCGGGGSGTGGTPADPPPVDVFPAPDPPHGVRAAFGDGSITVSWASLAGSSYRGFPVTTNVYISTSPNIDVRTFSESSTNQVMRGLNIMLPVVFRGLANGTPIYIVATDVANGVESRPSQEISVTPQPVPALLENVIALNDTGVDGCADLSLRNLPCPVVSLPNQDAERGRDAAARQGQLVKSGFGPTGFDFTKLDENGDPLPDDATTWPCVRDNVTGLIWEAPSDSGLTAAQNSYSWHEPDPLRNGGDPGQPNSGACAGSECDTHAFIQALSGAAHCGFQDWRLPTRRELFSLADFSRINPAIVASAFPNLPPSAFGFLWTSGTSSNTTAIGFHAWAMELSTGEMVSKPKTLFAPGDRPGYILAVRADEPQSSSPVAATAGLANQAEATCLNRENTSVPQSTPTSRYTVFPDGTLAAPATGLMWKRCLEGQTLNGDVCEGAPSTYMWADALGAAQAASFAGHSDWRLPNPKELLTIFEDRCAAPALNADLFPISGSVSAWTATPTALLMQDVFDEPWLLTFDGVVTRTSKFQTIPVLLVRDLP